MQLFKYCLYLKLAYLEKFVNNICNNLSTFKFCFLYVTTQFVKKIQNLSLSLVETGYTIDFPYFSILQKYFINLEMGKV